MSGFHLRGVYNMRSRMIAAGLLIFFISIILLSHIPIQAEAITYDPYEIPPGAPRWFPLIDFDEKGDQIELQIVFKLKPNGSFQERPIDILILESSKAKRNPSIEIARTSAIYIKEDVETRLEVVIENTMNAEMSLLFYNEQQDGDLENWDNATVKIRVDYQVTNVEKNESNLLLIIILVLLILITVGLLIGIGFFLLKRRMKAARTFFSPEGGLYYVFRDIDGSIMYFTPDQYTDMYNSHALVTYEYIGQAMKKGGPIMSPVEEQDMAGLEGGTMAAQPLAPSPLQSPLDAPAPVDQLPDSQYEDLYGPPSDVSDQPDLYDDQEHYVDLQPSMEPGTGEPIPESGIGEQAPTAAGEGEDVLDELVASAHSQTDESIDEPIAVLDTDSSEEPPQDQEE
jgi:hypothetical protein